MISKGNKKRIFLDYASSTPIDPKVLIAMEVFLKGNFANPSGIYEEGVYVRKEIEKARIKISETLGSRPKEIIFTSSGTESINLAIKGVFDYARRSIKKPHIVVSAFEHPSVLNCAKYFEENGGEATYLTVSNQGFVHPHDLRKAIKENTVLVSIMFANNEIGTIQPIKEIAKEIRFARKNVTKSEYPFFHTDTGQATCFLDLNVIKLGVDFLTLDGSKIYGPKGIAVLFAKVGTKFNPQILGGGQETGRRSGTENVAGIIGLSTALLLLKNKTRESLRLKKLRDFTWKSIKSIDQNIELNGSLEKRLPNNLNICFKGIDSEFMVLQLDARGIACSSSSSCRSSSENSRSYVIESIGKKECAGSSIRLTFGKTTTKRDIEKLLLAIRDILGK